MQVQQGRRKIKVHAYDGYRGAERPLRILLNNNKLEVKEIILAWIEPGRCYFRVKAGPYDTIMTIYYDESAKEWFQC